MTMRHRIKSLRPIQLAFSIVMAGAVITITTSSLTSQPGRSNSKDGLLPAAQCAANRAVATITYVSPFGFDASAGIIDVFAAKHLGYFADMCLNVEIVTNSSDPNELVSSGAAQFTNVGSAADAVNAISNGAQMVGIETAGHSSNYAVVTGKNITSLKQLDRKNLGYYSELPVIIHEMLIASGADISTIKLIADSNYDPTQVVHGTLQGLQAYQSNQVISLRASHEPFNEFTPQQFGIAGTYNVMTVNATFLRTHLTAVSDFMRADLLALHYCIKHPSACVNIEGQYAKTSGAIFDSVHEMAVWSLERKLTLASVLSGKGLGVQTYAEWKPEYEALRRFDVPSQISGLTTAENVSLVANLYRGRTLIWP